MASLRYSQPNEEDPKIGFSLAILGYEKGGELSYKTAKRRFDFEFNFDWFDCRLSIEALGKRIEHPKTKPMDYEELPYFITWLKEHTSKESKSFETIEPFFRVDLERRPRDTLFNLSLLLSAYGAVLGYTHVDSGVAIKFPVTGAQLVSFADELDKELQGLQSRYSRQIELWNQYKKAEMEKIAQDHALPGKKN